MPSQASGSGSNIPPQPETPPQNTSSSPSVPQDTLTIAEKIKEEGNVAFKTGGYQRAVDLYTKAIGKRCRRPLIQNSHQHCISQN